ncbi:MAG: hypothetical protein HKO13_00755 [Sphingomonas sp.]|nr:hypothetical protein [Sphingomonas sp.]RZV50904.1 MAG: hypothetical protein EX258_04625 [Sphingomonadaceae bacterium]
MRTLILLPFLAITACGDSAENVVVENTTDMSLDLEDTGADVTAIDAATGDASGMAGEPAEDSEED